MMFTPARLQAQHNSSYSVKQYFSKYPFVQLWPKVLEEVLGEQFKAAWKASYVSFSYVSAHLLLSLHLFGRVI